MTRHLLVASLLLIVISPLKGQEAPSAKTTITATPPAIDGVLNDEAWSEAPALSGFVQREPQEGHPVSQRTEVRILADGDALYVGAWLFDEDPSSIVLGQTLRDASMSESDAFSLIFDTYLDRQNGFVFATTPAGIEYDGQVSNEAQGGRGGGRQQAGSGGGFNLNWDGSWEVRTSTDADGWYVEMRIPFSTLRYERGGEQTWGLNIERSIRRNSEQAVLAPLPRQYSINRVSLAGTLDLEAPAKLITTVSPYVLGEAFKDYTVQVPDAELEPKVGGDAKIGLTQSLTLDLTVNTDFAQAEVDDQQVNLTRFSLFFPEKRAFFLENAGTFAVGSGRSAELFFSRRIGLSAGREVPIQAGARLTGRAAGLQIGALNIQTDDVSVVDDATGLPELVAPSTNFGVVRAFREFGNQSRVGAIVVSRLNTSNTDDYNLTYGQLGIGQDLTFDAWFGLTDTSPAAGDEVGSGLNDGEYGFNGGARYVTRNWQITAGYRQIGSQFSPEVGFVNRRAYRHFNTRISRNIRVPSVPWFREFRPHVSWSQFWDLGGFSESYLVHIDNHFAFENGAFFQLPTFDFTGEGLREPFEIRPGIIVPAGSYDNYKWEFRANTDRSAPLSVTGGWSYGGFFSGTRFGPNATVAYRYGDVLVTSLQVNYFDVRLDEGEFETAIVNFNASYSFTPRIYLQANLQYNDDTENLGINLRLGWLDTAATGLFIVYNDTEHLGRFVDTGVPAGPRQRQLVVKYTKLFDFTR